MTKPSNRTRSFSVLLGALSLGVWPGINWLSARSSVDSNTVTDAVAAVEFTAVSEDAEKCQLKLETQLIDFGLVMEGTKNRFPLRLTNSSNRPIRITSAKASCGCTKVLTETPFIVPPHQVRELDVQMDTARQTGSLTKTVNVFVEEPEAKYKLPVNVSALVKPLVLISTKRCDFGMLKTDQVEKQEIAITLLDKLDENAASRVKILKCPENVSAALSTPVITEQGYQQVTMTVSVDGNMVPEESISDDLILQTPSTVNGVVRVAVAAAQFKWVRCDPPRLDFGMVRETADVTRQLQLSGVDQKSWTVESIELNDAPDYLSAEKLADEQVAISLDAKAASKGFFNGKLKVRYRCEEGQQQSIVVPITGYRFTDG